MTPLRIAFLAGTLGQGGAERQLLYMAVAMARSGAAVRVLTFSRGEFFEEKLRQADIPVSNLKHESRTRRMRALWSELRSWHPHLVHSQHFYTNLYAVLAGGFLGVPAIGSLRSDVLSEIADVGGVAGQLSLRLPRLLVANSHPAVRTAASLGVSERRLRFLLNVVDTERFHPARERSVSGCMRLLAAGRLVPQKRFDRLLRVAARLREKYGDGFQLQLAGDGPLREELRAQRDQLGLGDVVKLDGSQPDLAPLYQSADLFVLTSDHEGTPNVVLEAMACGLPVVSMRVGGVPNLLEDGRNGFLCDDEEQLVEAIDALMADREQALRFGQASREIAEARYSIAQLADSLDRIYRSVLN